MNRPLILISNDDVSNGVSVRAYACEATPAQTVLHGLGVLCRERKPDLLVSGINYGDVTWTAAQHFVRYFAERMLAARMPHDVEPDSDIAAVLREGVVSVTPLSLDSTSRTDFRALDRRLRGP